MSDYPTAVLGVMSNYQQLCWNVTGISTLTEHTNADKSKTTVDDGDIGAKNFGYIAKAALDVWTDNKTMVLSASASGGRHVSAPPVISFTFRDGKSPAPSKELNAFTEKIVKALQKSLPTTTGAVLQNPERFSLFTEFSAQHVEPSTPASTGKTVVEAAFEADDIMNRFFANDLDTSSPAPEPEMAAAETATTTSLATTLFRDIPDKDTVEFFSLSQDVYKKIYDTSTKGPSDRERKGFIEVIILALVQIGETTDSNAVVNLMLASGIATIGSEMWHAFLKNYESYKTLTLAALVPLLVNAVGGARRISPLAAVLSSGVNALFLRHQSAKNVLMIVNLSFAEMAFVDDAVGNGERDVMTPYIPARPLGAYGSSPYPCAFYAYGKYTTPFAEGPWMGLTLATDTGEKLCIGMNCSNQVTGNPNSIQMAVGSATSNSKTIANVAKNYQGITNGSTVKLRKKPVLGATGVRSILWGNANLSVCFVIGLSKK